LLGESVFLEDFDLPNVMVFIFPDGAEVELSLGGESQFIYNHGGLTGFCSTNGNRPPPAATAYRP